MWWVRKNITKEPEAEMMWRQRRWMIIPLRLDVYKRQPINVLHCDYDAKEKQIQAVMDCIDGKVAYDDLNGDGKTWYNGYTCLLYTSLRCVLCIGPVPLLRRNIDIPVIPREAENSFLI